MIRQVEASWAWLESLAYQMNNMDKKEALEKLGGPLALLKAQSSITVEFCAREASQIFGGLAYTRGGQGLPPLYRVIESAFNFPLRQVAKSSGSTARCEATPFPAAVRKSCSTSASAWPCAGPKCKRVFKANIIQQQQ